jgi:hypothetical protein
MYQEFLGMKRAGHVVPINRYSWHFGAVDALEAAMERTQSSRAGVKSQMFRVFDNLVESINSTIW